MVFLLVFDRFQPAPNSEVPGSRTNPRFKILPPEYLGTYALNFSLSDYVPRQKSGVGATGLAKRAGLRPDLKFDVYTQNSSDL
jgi:hypothetical protein